jgi:hypothetical protein
MNMSPKSKLNVRFIAIEELQEQIKVRKLDGRRWHSLSGIRVMVVLELASDPSVIYAFGGSLLSG